MKILSKDMLNMTEITEDMKFATSLRTEVRNIKQRILYSLHRLNLEDGLADFEATSLI